MSFRVIPIPAAVAEETRRTRLSPGFGHAVQTHVASAQTYGPCRSCLRRTREGERRLLLSYNPYPEAEQVPVVGPIYIHEDPCEPYAGPGFPEELRNLPMALRGHHRDGSAIVNVKLEDRSPEAAIEALFRDERIAYIAIQNPEAACFIARVERA
jgi:hypothetical protein